ncbi:nitroreductase family protein [Gilvibacter sediminis]|uniref:nitroreductase family protein n=1 Tax=Gilvibacter sediminis TaxID=379071 RepID=UPI0023509869|nr:nitroreductase [Gilvibacter sediminis]MDC7997263.1 nitroreductase [Gilvibacter sediminis]
MISDLIHKRRSVYPALYADTPIAKETIEELLMAAHQAPTHRKTQPWRFKVFHTEQKRAELGDFLALKYRNTISNYSEFKEAKIRKKPADAACVIAICVQEDPDQRVPYWEELAATAMAVQNLWLACTEKGIGGYWSSPALMRYMDEFITLEAGEKCIGFFYMGNLKAELPEPWERNPLDQHVNWF